MNQEKPAPDAAGLREAFIWYDERTAQNVVAAKDYEALRLATPAPLDEAEPSYIEVRTTACHAGSDGDCSWSECPQLRDGEPTATGRHCPLDRMPTSPAETARRFPLATAYAAAPGPVGLPEREYGTLRDRCVHSPCCMTLRQHDERIVPSPDPVGLREALDTPENHDPEGHDALPEPALLASDEPLTRVDPIYEAIERIVESELTGVSEWRIGLTRRLADAARAAAPLDELQRLTERERRFAMWIAQKPVGFGDWSCVDCRPQDAPETTVALSRCIVHEARAVLRAATPAPLVEETRRG